MTWAETPRRTELKRSSSASATTFADTNPAGTQTSSPASCVQPYVIDVLMIVIVAGEHADSRAGRTQERIAQVDGAIADAARAGLQRIRVGNVAGKILVVHRP